MNDDVYVVLVVIAICLSVIAVLVLLIVWINFLNKKMYKLGEFTHGRITDKLSMMKKSKLKGKEKDI